MKPYDESMTNEWETTELIKELMKSILQLIMKCELDTILGYEKCQRILIGEPAEKKLRNYRNGYSVKTIHTQYGEIDLQIPRDRKGLYEPLIIGKYDRIVRDLERKILSLYICCEEERLVESRIKGLYDIEISEELVKCIAEKVIPQMIQWKNRLLKAEYQYVRIVGHYHDVKYTREYINRKVYVAVGYHEDEVEILGIWIKDQEQSIRTYLIKELAIRGVMHIENLFWEGVLMECF